VWRRLGELSISDSERMTSTRVERCLNSRASFRPSAGNLHKSEERLAKRVCKRGRRGHLHIHEEYQSTAHWLNVRRGYLHAGEEDVLWTLSALPARGRPPCPWRDLINCMEAIPGPLLGLEPPGPPAGRCGASQRRISCLGALPGRWQPFELDFLNARRYEDYPGRHIAADLIPSVWVNEDAVGVGDAVIVIEHLLPLVHLPNRRFPSGPSRGSSSQRP
jgi:hypothetical protein